ncbi:cystathionine gamma-lyase-like [Tropilaelaps mercedesae]|uniref:cystathionine gamma-lyase n=1 Tax=Tropilaelaps mercedesae TaxID=418985 RepID=A0A1V9XHB2_9ACAR|nr:cystathionine gamma-lyase-like [Tropilaelaps mercedesae]
MHPPVLKVLHPDLQSHPQYELAKKQCSGFSGILSFYITGSKSASRGVLKSLKILTFAESLGLWKKRTLGITDNLIRLSVGLESRDDVIDDLEKALEAATKAAE